MNKTHLHVCGPEADPRAFAPGPSGKLSRLYYGSGGGSAPKNYANLEALYGEQAASARLLRGMAEQNLPGVTRDYVAATKPFTSPYYAESQARLAAADFGSASAMERQATERSMASMGVNPNDPRFAGSMRSTELSNAAMMGAGKNTARNDANKMRLAVAQDAVGTFTGQSNSASAQMASATGGMSNLASQQQQAQMNKDAQRQNAVAATVGGGMAMWNALKDGGRVTGPRGIKRIERHFLGGQAGSQQHGYLGAGQATPTPPPQVQQPQQAQGPGMADMVKFGKEFNKKEGTIGERMTQRGAAQTEKMGRVANVFSKQGGRNMYSQAAGQRMGAGQIEPAAKAYEAAAGAATDPAMQQQYLDVAANMRSGAGLEGVASTTAPAAAGTAGTVGAGIGGSAVPGATTAVSNAIGGAGAMSTVPGASSIAAGLGAPGTIAGGMSTAGTVAGGLSTAGAGTTTALATGTASAGAGAMATVGAALPWVGAAIGVASLLGLFKDGGKVQSYANTGEASPPDEYSRAFNDEPDVLDYNDGAKVPGEWQGNTDKVPALLTEEEYVLPAESVALIGDEQLEQIRQKGLQMRRKGLTPGDIRGLRAASANGARA